MATTKDFIEIASVVRELPLGLRELVAGRLAKQFKRTHERFDKARFYSACDVSLEPSDTYRLVVVVERSRAEDSEYLVKKTAEKQLAWELQDGWDEACIAGHFEVLPLEEL